MRRLLPCALLCICVLLSCAAPASAYQVHSWGEIGPDSYTVEYML